MLIKVNLDSGSLVPPMSVALNAAQALQWQKEYQRGLSATDIKRAEMLHHQYLLPLKSLQKMWNYFQRTKEETEISDPPTNQQILWAGNGGKPAFHWLKLLKKRGVL